MKIMQINTTCGKGSTGKICVAVSELLSTLHVENYIFYTNGSSSLSVAQKYATMPYIKLQALKARVFGNWGFNSKRATRRLLRELDRNGVDVLQIHNIHGHDCNLDMLFGYIRKRKLKVFWTFHDCWAFTGSCMHYTMVKCDGWKKECRKCPQWKNGSWFFDRNAELLVRKKKLLSGLDLTIITPSQWLANQVKQSFLKDYPVKVINNGIDLNVFKPTASDFRKRYNCEDKRIVLGVSMGWSVKKGLDVFAELASRLPENYQIVIVGGNEQTDRQLPSNVISIHRTQNQLELAEVYTAADVFVNPTREDTFPTVNIEALACGTPVITFKTGGSPEIIDEICGIVVECDDVDALETEIIRVCTDRPYTQEACVCCARKYSAKDRFLDYVTLYKEKGKHIEQ